MSDGRIVELAFRPTIDKNSSKYEAQPAWVSCDHIRFQDGKPQKLGGWVSEIIVSGSVVGVPRAILPWISNTGRKYLAVGTNAKLQVFFENTWYDITPIRTISSAANVTTSTSSELVLVSLTSHGALAGDYVAFTSMSASIGNVLLSNKEYPVASVISNNAFYITYGSVATSTATMTSVTTTFFLPTGRTNNEVNRGYGGGTYGTSGVSASAGWSDPRTSDGGSLPLRLWSLANWGEDLLAVPRGGALYHWKNPGGPPNSRASIVASAPSLINVMKVNSESRQVILYGVQVSNAATSITPNLVRWSNTENFAEYSASAANTAGDFPLSKGGEIVGVVDTKYETLIATQGGTLYSQKLVGGNDIFSFAEIDSGITPASQNAMISKNNIVYIWGTNGFWKYDGTLKQMNSSLDTAIFDSDNPETMNFSQKEKVFLGLNTRFNEWIGFYPAGNSLEPNRYVICNDPEESWADGYMNRTVWADSGIFEKPYALSSAGLLYLHEQGFNDDATPLSAFIETSDFDVDSGNDLIFIDKILPDFAQSDNLKVNFTLYSKKYNFSSWTEKGPYPVNNTTEKISLRARGRSFKFKYSTSATDSDFEAGDIRVVIKEDGKR